MLYFKFATNQHVDLYYEWASDPLVREQSINSEKINYNNHVKWFTERINNPDVFMYIFFNESNEAVGQVRIERKKDWAAIGQSIDKNHRGKKYSSSMLKIATDDFLSKNPLDTIVSIVKNNNIASLKMAKNSGFRLFIEKSKNITYVFKGHSMNDSDYIKYAKNMFK